MIELKFSPFATLAKEAAENAIATCAASCNYADYSYPRVKDREPVGVNFIATHGKLWSALSQAIATRI